MSPEYVSGALRGSTVSISGMALVYAVAQGMNAAWVAFLALWTAYTLYRLVCLPV